MARVEQLHARPAPLFVAGTLLLVLALGVSAEIAATNHHLPQQQQQRQATPSTWEDGTIRSQYVIVHVEQSGHATIAHVRPSSAEPSRCLTPTEVAERRLQKKAVMLSYDYPIDDAADAAQPPALATCILGAADPRVLYHDHLHHETGAHGGGMLSQDGGVAVTVHPAATHLHVLDATHPEHAIVHDLRRAFTEQGSVSLTNSHALHVSASKPLVGDPNTQYNIVFVSAGYDGNARSNFDAEVQDLLLFFNGANGKTGVSSLPFTPYYAVMNFFQVFIPSNEVGASNPRGKSVQNNLGCSYGIETNAILTCNRFQAMLAASYAPVDPLNTLIIVLVNAEISGGSGGANVAVINNRGEAMYALLMHMIGHAASDLSDEYSYGNTESKEVPMLNCHWLDHGLPWQRFKERQVVPIASKPCTFANYFRPTEGKCVMASLQETSLCPVCGFNQLKTMYDHGMQLANPMYPNIHETAQLVMGSGLVLYINPTIPYLKSPDGKHLFTVDWTVDGSNFGSQVHEVGFGMEVNGRGWTYTTPGVYTVNVTITDNTIVILDDDRRSFQLRDGFGPKAITQVVTFTILVFKSVDDPRTCTRKAAGGFGTTYCATCKNGKICELTYTATPLTSIAVPTAKLSGIEVWMVAVGLVIVGLGVLLFYGSWRFMIYHQERNPVEILPLTNTILYIRALLIGVQLCVLIVSTFSIIYSVYQLGQLEIFGQAIVLGVIACAAVVWLGSYVGLVAAYFKNRSLLFVNFILLLLLFGCVFLFSILLVYVLTNISDPGVQEQLVGEWNTAVQTTPEKVCRLQLVLGCSGYNASCAGYASTSPGGSTNCPTDCLAGNLLENPCSSEIRKFISEHFGAASAGGWVLTFLLFIALLTSVILGCAIKNRRNVVHRERRVRHATGQNILEPEEIAMLRKEFDKIDIDGSGDISRDEFSRFYNSVMGTDLSPRELEEYFDRLDADGNGTLSFEEFLKVYVPHREPKRKSMVKPKNLQYIESDSDEDVGMESRGVTPRAGAPEPAPPASMPVSARSNQYAVPPPKQQQAPPQQKSQNLKGSYQESAPPTSSRQQGNPKQQQRGPPPASNQGDFDFDFNSSSPNKPAAGGRGQQQQQQQKKGYDDLDLDIDLDAEW